MSSTTQSVITRTEERLREAWGDPATASVTWFTLFSSDITPTDSLGAGIAEIPAGDYEANLRPHRHAKAELYYILEGSGILTIDGKESAVTKGSAVFIPGDAWHALRNEAAQDLKLFYVFPTGRFGDVVYEYPA